MAKDITIGLSIAAVEAIMNGQVLDIPVPEYDVLIKIGGDESVVLAFRNEVHRSLLRLLPAEGTKH
jgi:hypothetical protein